MKKKDDMAEGKDAMPEGIKNAETVPEKMSAQGAENGEKAAEKINAQGTENREVAAEEAGGQETGNDKTAAVEQAAAKTDKDQAQKKGKKNGGGRLRTVLGIAIMLAGICVCLYPFYRQKKSDNFNEDAINMILTPQPTTPKQQEPFTSGGTPTAVPDITQAVPTLPESPDASGEEGEPDGAGEELAVLGEDLLENPDAPEEQPEEEEQQNANRLNGKTVIGVIQIPKIELIYAIVEGSDAAEIGVAIGHMSSTAQLGEIGNCALAGHRGGYSGPYFKNLDKLEIGDEVIITNTKQQVFTYKVTETMIVQPDEVWVIEDTGEEVAMLTLVTCENSGTQRLIVRCVAK